MFSKACEYGIRAVIYIANQSLNGNKVSLKDVAKEIASPEAYTSKILQLLSKKEVIKSEKGPSGGFLMDKNSINQINLSQVVNAIDGEELFSACGLGLKKCNEKTPCPVHDQFKEIREKLKYMLDSTTIISLAIDVNNGLSFLKI